MRSVNTVNQDLTFFTKVKEFLEDKKSNVTSYNPFTHFVGSPENDNPQTYYTRPLFQASSYDSMNRIHLVNNNNVLLLKLNEFGEGEDKIGSVQFIWNKTYFSDSEGADYTYNPDFNSIYIGLNQEKINALGEEVYYLDNTIVSNWKIANRIKYYLVRSDGSKKLIRDEKRKYTYAQVENNEIDDTTYQANIDIVSYEDYINSGTSLADGFRASYVSDDLNYFPDTPIKYPRLLLVKDYTSPPEITVVKNYKDNVKFSNDTVSVNGDIADLYHKTENHIRSTNDMEFDGDYSYRFKVENYTYFNTNIIRSLETNSNSNTPIYFNTYDKHLTIGEIRKFIDIFLQEVNYFKGGDKIKIISLFQMYEWVVKKLEALGKEITVIGLYDSDENKIKRQKKIVKNLALEDTLTNFKKDAGLYDKINLTFGYAKITSYDNATIFNQAKNTIKKRGYKYIDEVNEVLKTYDLTISESISFDIKETQTVSYQEQTGTDDNGNPIYTTRYATIKYYNLTNNIDNEANTKGYLFLAATIGFDVNINTDCEDLTQVMVDGLIDIIQAVSVVSAIVSAGQSMTLSSIVNALIVSYLAYGNPDQKLMKRLGYVYIIYQIYSRNADTSTYINLINITMSEYGNYQMNNWREELEKAMQDAQNYYDNNKEILEKEITTFSFGDGNEYNMFYEKIFEPMF